MYLVIAEKPSVSRTLAKVIGAYKREDGYLTGRECIVSWCLGHLAEYAPPEAYGKKYKKWEFGSLPILPEKWELQITEATKKQFEVLKGLLNRKDFTYVVNACDAGREGELIFKRVYDLSGSTLPVRRLWISSMEDAAISDGFANLKDGADYEKLAEAAVCRAKADWLVGMNGTRAFTTTYGKVFKVGRVQTPTLAMLVERQKETEGFQKELYYKVRLDAGSLQFFSENIRDREEAARMAARCNGRTAVVEEIRRGEKKSAPPELYDLTALQREANRQFGYTAKETLDTLQELYEEKFLTYPRTDSRYVTGDMEGTVLELAGEMMEEFLDFSFYADVKRVVNQAKVSDHHAILPTEQALKKDWKELPEKKGNLLYLTALQVLKAVSGDFRYEETEVTVSCGGQAFKAKGRKLLQPGYRKTEEIFREKHFPATGHRKEEGGEQSFPDYLKESYTFPGVTAGISEHFTTPPAPYSEDTLLAAMENAGKKEFEKETEKKGLGTPATRAAVIEKLVTSGYVRRNGRQILPTEAGCELVSILPDHLKSAAMTAQWENKLLAVEKETVESARFLEEIVGMVREVLEECRNIPVEEQQRFRGKEEVGRCPVCRGPVYEEKWNFCCGNRDCSFALWKDDHYLACMQKKMDRCMASELLNEGKTFVKDFYSTKKKKHFEAALLMEVKDGMVQFRLEFPKKGKKK